MGTTAGNMKAQGNGRAIEVQILGKQISSHHVLDTPRLEVKTVQDKVNYVAAKRGWRYGSFVLYHHQHKLLLANKGSYLFNVIDEKRHIIKQKKISAKKIEERFQVLGRPQMTLYHPTVFAARAA
jgi:hypothetical protein